MTGTDAVPGIGVLAGERRLSPPNAVGDPSAGPGASIALPDSGGVASGELSIALVAMMVLSALALAVPRVRRGRQRWDPSAPW